MEIRECSSEDQARVCTLWGTVFGYPETRNDPRRVIADKLAWDRAGRGRATLLVAVRTGELLGTLMVGYDGHRGWLYRLAVAPAERRRGVASALVLEAERRLVALGCAKINLQMHVHNEGAAEFWRASGYVVEPRVSMGKALLQA